MTAPVVVPARRYPAGPITPHGSYYILNGTHPEVQLRAYDDSIWFDLMGGRAIPDRYTAPEVVILKRDGLKGLIPPWRTIDQKGATEDGVHFVDALYDPIEVVANVSCRGRDGRRTRKVVGDLIASIDVKKTSQLSWFTQDMGYWWADLRWFKTPPDVMMVGGQHRRQDLTLILRADNGFWRSYDSAAGLDAASGTAFLDRINVGDQPMFDRYTCFGPGTFRFADGPGSTQMVEFGPLLPGQVAQIRTDPRKRSVVDLTAKPPSTQERAQFQDAMNSLASFTSVLSVFQSIFGILGTGPVPPQGNLYSLLKGRFSDNAAIPAKSPGNPAETKHVKVEIVGGDANTMILCAGTPQRRLPY